MDLFQAMSVYVKVVEAGNMTAAARECGMSTTMVGNHLRALEQRLGVRLLNRTTRRQRLTDFGRDYYQRCLAVLGLVADSERLAEQVQGEPTGTLRITAPLTFGTERLAPALDEFRQRCPQVKVELTLANQRFDLTDGTFDLAVRLGNLDNASLIARRLQDYTLTICAAPEYLERCGTPQVPEDLQRHNCLAFAYPAGDEWSATATLWPLRGPEGDVQVPVSGSLLTNTSSGLHRAARGGLGLVMMPDALVEEDLQQGRLVPVLQDYQLPFRTMHLLYAQDRYRLPKLRSFVDFALEKWGRQADSLASSIIAADSV
ncbi:MULTISPECIES: LysR family transcriptional regulator [Pseudomonas]|uniref:LysR family transcriptional regulator n=1 Tax=Pseudomonas TaxID=286 RepID=UPI0028E0D395|nr:LysR family transcriptional regulator [Pseudomonas sp. JV245A]MDT9643405.1 LysR family transcriptional regulator [Pseudomonas sp. JV245A]